MQWDILRNKTKLYQLKHYWNHMLHLCYFLKINISSLKKKFLKKIGNLCNHKDITVRKCIVLSKDSYININTTVVNSFLCGLDCSLVVTFELFLKL